MYHRGGYYCICRGCPSKTGRGLSFFTIPKDSSRASAWLKACNREDLLEKNPDTHNYRLCELHFEEKYLSKGGLRKTLFLEAIPTLFPGTSKCVTDEGLEEPSKKVIVLSETVVPPPTVEITEVTPAKKSPSPGSSHTQCSKTFELPQEIPPTSPLFSSSPSTQWFTPGSSDMQPSSQLLQEITPTSQLFSSSPSTQWSTPGSSGMQHSSQLLQEITPTSRLFSSSTQWSTPGPSGMQHSEVPEFLQKTPPTSPLLSPSSLTQTPAWLTAGTPRKTKLRMEIKALRQQRRRRVVKQEKQEPTLQEFYDLCDKFLSKPLAEIVKSEALLKQRKSVARRYSSNYKQFALTLYFLGPRAYRFLSKLLCLPTKRSLQRLTEKLVCKPGVNNAPVFKALQIKAKTMMNQDKHCTLCFDEMALKSNLFYHTSRDELVGLIDTGGASKEFAAAQNALVIMARGLYSNWKQPIAYFFAGAQLQANKLKPLIIECISMLENVGIHVEGLVSDMGSNFIELANSLGVTPDNPEFHINGKNIIYFFDTCHLIKATRNSLIKNTFQFDGKQTSWTYIEEFYKKDKQQFYRCAPKLTNAHIYPSNFEKMKVGLATQVMSNTVASGMNTYMTLGALPTDAIGTIEFIEKFNKLFDLLNSSEHNHPNKFKNVFEAADFQLNFLNEMVTFFNQLKISNKNGDNITSKSRVKKCWVITINGIKSLWEKLKLMGFKYLQTRRVNTDCLENFFGSVRQQGGNSVNPTPIQFERSFRKLFCQNYLHSDHMNCGDDLDELLLGLINFKESNIEDSESDSDSEEIKAISLPDYDYRSQNITAQNAFNYVCGYLIKKALGVHSCETCIKYSIECNELDITQLLTYFKAYETEKRLFGGLRVPSEEFVNYIFKLEKSFLSLFEKITVGPGISHLLLNNLKTIQFIHPCNKFPALYVLKLFIRLKIFYTLKYTNRELVCNKRNKNRKLTIICHL